MRSAIPLVLTLALPAVAQDPRPASTGTESGAIELPGIRKLKIGGEYRIRYENLHDYFSNRPRQTVDFFTQRVRLNFDVDVNDDLGAFVQIQDVRDWGEESSTTDRSADGLDLHQAWMVLRKNPAIGGATKVGRQVISLGAQRLVGGLEWKSQGRSFDGVMQTWSEQEKYTVHAFGLQLVEDAASVLAQTPNYTHRDTYLAGTYATLDLGTARGLDLYYILIANETAGVGETDHLSTVGTRWFHQAGALDFEVELATQFGEAGAGRVPAFDTWAGHAHVRYTGDSSAAPWLLAAVDAATGDDPATAGENERFNNLLPTGHMHWGMMDLAAWSNLSDVNLGAGMKVGDKGALSVNWFNFRAMEETDQFGGPNGVVTGGGAAGSSKEIGNEIDLLYTVKFDAAPAKSSLQVGLGVFLPGSAAKAANGSDDPAYFGYVMTGVAF